MDDKQIEQQRYNHSSAYLLNSIFYDETLLKVLGAEAFPSYLQPPYLFFHKFLEDNIKFGDNQLDLCCGNGLHSFTGAKKGALVIGLDFAEKSIEICKKRASLLNLNVDFRTADVQAISFENGKFDIVTCVGSLSYLDNDTFLNEVHRVLKQGGVFLCLDSFNHNPIYKFNRFIHYLRGNRSYSTLTRMPNLKTIQLFEKKFNNVKVSYFGIFIFIAPMLKFFISPDKINLILNKLDHFFSKINRYAFKVVIQATK